MKFLAICFSLLGFFSFDSSSSSLDGIESTVIQCGNTPDGNWDCVSISLDDGSDCLVIDNEGAPGGIQFVGC